MKNKYNCISVANIRKALVITLIVILPNLLIAQENSQASSIQSGVTFQWADNQNSSLNDPATIESVTVNGLEYNTFVVPTSYRMTTLGPDGNSPNRIMLNGGMLPGNSASANWLSNATSAFQDKNLNHYFTANPNGRNICSDSVAAQTTDAQKQTIFYNPSIPSNADAILAVTERGGNNCFFLKVWGIPAAGGSEQELGQTFVRNVGNYRDCTFAPPSAGSDYWQSGRCNENGQTIGIGLFYLNDIAETGSKITKIEFIAATQDHGDGKFFILQKYAVDQQSINCIDTMFEGDLNINNNVPENSTYSIETAPSPAGLSFTLNPNGTYSFMPPVGFTGEVNFEYKVCLPAPNTSVCDTGNVTLNFVALPDAPEIDISCSTPNNFTITVTSPLGDAYQYSLNNGTFQSDPNFTNLAEGSYTLKIKNRYTDCENEHPQNPIVLDNLELTGSVTDVLCKLGDDGAIDITASGGAPPYTYLWSNSATSEDLSNIFGSTYTVTVTDSNGCTISSDFTVNQPSEELASTISSTNVLCKGNNTGAIDLTITGGTAPYTVLWNNGSTTEDQSDLITGNYTVTITDANGCVASNNITINEPTETLTATINTVNNVSCAGESTGSLTIEAIGGTSPYTYSLDNGTNSQSSGVFDNLSAGDYTILITDANNCTFSIDGVVETDDLNNPEITVPSAILIEGCLTTDITSNGNNFVFNYSDIQSANILSLFNTNIGYNVSDDVSISSVTYMDVIAATNCPLVITRTFTATDACGNIATADQTITVQDTTPPTITAPADVTIECTDDESSANTGVATGTDTCGEVTISQSDVETATCGNTKTIVRTWTATDACGNIATADQTITVQDTTPPTITAPADVTIECTDDESSANTGVAAGTDTCGEVTISQSDVETATCGNTKTIVRTWTATDACGNTATADQTITVQDTTPPTITAPTDVTIECTDDESSANTGVAAGTDTCGEVTISQSDVETATCGNTKTIVRTWTATDACGNTATADQTITVQDTTPPTITAPADVTIECTDDESSANTGVAVGTDTCGEVTISQSDVETATCGNTKTIVRTWTATDACGNITTADQTITVQDTTPPTITAPADVTIECTDDESSANTGVAAGTDTCGEVTISQSDVETATCGNTKTIVRTWTATDACGNTATADQTITVQDTTPPTIDNTNANDIIIQCGVTPDGTLEAWLNNNSGATATDTCGSITWSNDYGANTDVDCANGAITITFTATDDCGNSATTTSTYAIIDTVAPVLSIPLDITIECNENTTPGNTGTATATDDCANPTINFVDAETATCGNTKTIVRTWTATDACGNTATADQTITVQDTTPPTITAPADVTIECTDDESSANTGVAVGTDTCGEVTISQSDVETATCGNTKTIVRTWTATDACGNITTADQTITVQDTTPPTITAPADVTIECTDDESSANTGVAAGTDTCGEVTISQSDVETATCGNTKTIVRTWTATDACGNTATADQTITVQDTTPPTIDNTNANDIIIQCGVTPDGTLEAWLNNNSGATATDTCGSITWSNDYGANTDVDCANGAITITFTATDDCGNSATTTSTYAIIDTVAPVLSIPLDITIECNENTTPGNTGTATATDDCANPTINFVDAETATCGNTKTIVRTWTATDACGNTATADQTITVQDTTPPTITAPADVTIECNDDESSANTGIATGTDTCGEVTISQSDVETATCGNTKTIVRTWTATDACGNITTADQTITVQDTTPPTITAPADVTIECTDDESSANTGIAAGTDTCGEVTISQSDVETATCGNTKTIVRTWTATDACGNITTADQTITVQDTTPPTITVPADVTIECTDDESSANTGVATGTDTCGEVTISQSDVETATCGNTKTIIRTWTATDACGNTATADQTITVQDTTPPTITMSAQNIVVECDGSENNTDIQNWLLTNGGATASDTCGSITWTNDYNGNATDCSEPIEVTFTATDSCGNAIDTSATYTIQDTNAPNMINQASDLTTECDGQGNTDQLNNWLSTNGGASATDNCSTLTWSNNFTELTESCGATGFASVTFTATDSCGNSTSTTASFVIEDTTAPTFTVPDDITIECDINATDLTITGDVTDEADNCDNGLEATFTDTIVNGDCANASVITRMWTLTDACDNTTALMQTINVVDTTAPTFTVPADITIECDVNATDLTITGDVTDEDDNCDTGLEATFTDTIANGDCANASVITRMWTLTDACNNTTTLMQTINVVDTTAPTFTVPADTTIECDVNATDLTITGDVTDEADNCDTGLEATFTDTITNGDCDNASVITRMWTLTDACNNTTTLMQTINVVDTTAPTFTVTADITIECDVNATDLTITGDVTDEDDNCDTSLEATFTDTIANGDCANASVITRMWTLTDACNNITTLMQTINVVDTTAPTFTVPADITIECDVNATDLTITGDVTDEDDNCDTGLEATFTDTIANGDCANASVITRTWTLTDACNNTTTLMQTINVVDTTAPIFNESLPEDTTLECDTIPDGNSLTASDNCGDATVTFIDEITEGTCENEFTLVRTWTASDSCNNTTTHTQTINVIDTTAPSFNESLPIDLNVECQSIPSAETLTANDNCGIATVSFEETITNGACTSDFIITRSWTAIDSCGNDTIHTQIITVQDNTTPTLVSDLEENITVACDAIPEVPNLVFEDACSNAIEVTFNETSTQANDFEDYEITRIWTVIDDCGNEANFMQTITVEISNVIETSNAERCVLDVELDLFDLLSGDFDMDGTWSVVSGNTSIDGSLFDPSTAEVGNYVFRYSITEGACPKEVEVTVAIDDECLVLPCSDENNVIISKTVTANGDNFNEFFTITGVEFCGFTVELEIFNRWGAKIYESKNYQNNWNGDAHGSSVGSSGKIPTGTYYYIINLRDSGLKPFAGPIYVATNK